MSTTCTGPQLFNGLREAFKIAAKPYMLDKKNPHVLAKVGDVADAVAFSLLNNDRNNDQRVQALHQIVDKSKIGHDRNLLKSIIKSVIVEVLRLPPETEMTRKTPLRVLNDRFPIEWSKIEAKLREKFNLERVGYPETFGQLLDNVRDQVVDPDDN